MAFRELDRHDAQPGPPVNYTRVVRISQVDLGSCQSSCRAWRQKMGCRGNGCIGSSTMTSMTNMDGPSTAQWIRGLSERTGPVLTWYSTGRVELTGPVLARWLAKIDNYLGSEFAFGESSYHLDLPDCWQKTIWECALLLRGWEPVDLEDSDVVVTNNTQILERALASGAVALAQPTDPLGLTWGADLPPGATDAPGELMGQADTPEQSLGAGPLWAIGSDLLAGLSKPLGRTFLEMPSTHELLQLWAGGGSAVIIDDWSQNQDRTQSLMAQEQIEHVLAH